VELDTCFDESLIESSNLGMEAARKNGQLINSQLQFRQRSGVGAAFDGFAIAGVYSFWQRRRSVLRDFSPTRAD